MEDALDTDTIVRIEGLVSRGDLNGCRALVLSHIVTERVAVRVLSTNESVKVKPANLVRIRDAVAIPEIDSEAQLAGVRAALNISDKEVDVAADDAATITPEPMPRCAECAAFGATKICVRCKSTHYCSKDCQLASWPTHKLICSAKVELKESGGRGVGLFARISFATGDEIYREKPLLVYPGNVPSVNRQEANDLMASYVADIFSGLSDATKHAVMDLRDSKLYHGSKSLKGIIFTNGIPLASGAAERAALFALTCRLNHACKPNARYFWRDDLDYETVLAQRPIAAGEEITVCYKEGYAPCAVRQAHLLETFGFTCGCLACLQYTAESDDRMQEIQTLIDEVPRVGYADQRRALKMSERTLRLMHAEGVNTPVDLAVIHYDAYQMALASGDRRKAKSHLQSALDYAKLSEGLTSPLAARHAARLRQL